MAETNPKVRGWLLGLGLIMALFLLALTPLAISKLVPDQSYDSRVSPEMAVIESLAQLPADYPTFVAAVEQRNALNERELKQVHVPYNANPSDCVILARADEASQGLIDSPVVWYDGLGADDVKRIYAITFYGGGGCWGCGGARGWFHIFVGAKGKIVGWYTTEPEWRAKVLELSRP